MLETMRELERQHGDELTDAALIHSDQGCHYTSHAFRNTLCGLELIQSMSRRGCCWDNSPMESFFGRMKDHIREAGADCGSPNEIREKVSDYINYYNNDRCQWDLAKLSLQSSSGSVQPASIRSGFQIHRQYPSHPTTLRSLSAAKTKQHGFQRLGQNLLKCSGRQATSKHSLRPLSPLSGRNAGLTRTANEQSVH